MNEHYNVRESDYNSKKAQELYGDKTVEELEREIEEFEKNFKKEHEN